jgi:hypothetical protein
MTTTTLPTYAIPQRGMSMAGVDKAVTWTMSFLIQGLSLEPMSHVGHEKMAKRSIGKHLLSYFMEMSAHRRVVQLLTSWCSQ